MGTSGRRRARDSCEKILSVECVKNDHELRLRHSLITSRRPNCTPNYFGKRAIGNPSVVLAMQRRRHVVSDNRLTPQTYLNMHTSVPLPNVSPEKRYGMREQLGRISNNLFLGVVSSVGVWTLTDFNQVIATVTAVGVMLVTMFSVVSAFFTCRKIVKDAVEARRRKKTKRQEQEQDEE